MRAIAMIAMKEGINQKDLAFLLGIRPQTMGEILRKLEDACVFCDRTNDIVSFEGKNICTGCLAELKALR